MSFPVPVCPTCGRIHAGDDVKCDICMMREDRNALLAERDALKGEVARLRQALEWYADGGERMREDWGTVARKALGDGK